MQTYLLAAAVLAVLIAAAHSVLGEILIFRHLRSGSIVPALSAPPLKERHVRILWASWHLVSVCAAGFSAVLVYLASPGGRYSLAEIVLAAVMFTHLGGALPVLVGTRGRHPGWIGLLGVTALVWAAATSTQ
ncbi:MAG: hypothetical protein HOQ32_02145 [Lysobacter sp.]|nr:hypothetical protein [Lysobacter sp.]